MKSRLAPLPLATRHSPLTHATRHLPLALGLLGACTVTPLTNKVRPGDEAFVVVVGEGEDRETDLFAAPAAGGKFTRLSFNRLVEDLPELSPAGTAVAYVRTRSAADSVPHQVVVLDLLTNDERTANLPEAAPRPDRLGWARDGSVLYVWASGAYRVDLAAHPLTAVPVGAAELAQADSAAAELLGDPPQGAVKRCGGWACIVAATGDTTSLGEGVGEAIRWGPDSVAYFKKGSLLVRPLTGGHTRQPLFHDLPANLRRPTYHPGVSTTPSGEAGLKPPR